MSEEDTEYLEEALIMAGLKEKDSDLSESQYAKQMFLQEVVDHRQVKFKLIYVDMVGGDVLSGLLLSQIMYWHLPTEEGKIRLRVYKDGHYWIAKEQDQWWEETRLTRRQAQRCIEILISLNLIETRSFRFNGLKTNHIRIKWKEFAIAHKLALKTTLNKVKHADVQPEAPVGAFGFTLAVQPLTETTAETTTIYSAGAEKETDLLSAISQYLHQTLNGTYSQVNPTVKIDEHPNTVTIGVNIPQPALKAAITRLLPAYTKKKYKVKVVVVPAVNSRETIPAERSAELVLNQAYKSFVGGEYVEDNQTKAALRLMAGEGVTTEQLLAVCQTLKADKFWSDKISLKAVADHYSRNRAKYTVPSAESAGFDAAHPHGHYGVDYTIVNGEIIPLKVKA